MNIVHVTAASVGVAALLWWGLFPAELASEQFQALGRLPALLDATATTPALRQLASLDRFGLFPSAEEAGPAPNAAELRLQGTIMTPRRNAALISVAGAKPQWIALGEPVAGLEVVELHSASAIVRTASGDTVTLEMFKAATDGQAVGETSNAAN